jgi:ribosomal protein S18 acetylase RimI-like enzyme
MQPAEQAQAHDRNFISAISMLAETLPSGSTARYGSIPIAMTGVAGAFFNAVWVVERPQPADLQAALDAIHESGLPFTVHVRSDLVEVISAAASHDLTDEGRLPCFAMKPGPVPPPPPHLSIKRVGPSNWNDFLDATEVGFGMSRELVEGLLVPGLLDHDRARAFVGMVYGRAVATALSIPTGSTVGVYNVATVPDARGRGIGTAMTWHLLADADPGWDVAVLQSSEMGRPIYERMGFRLIREFAELVGGPTG